MPTIEIISVQAQPMGLDQKDYEMAIWEEPELHSHRSLFFDWLKPQKGVIVHLGNPDFKAKDSAYYADRLVDWDFWKQTDFQRFRILGRWRTELEGLLQLAMEHSPVSQVYFLTDDQVGPKKGSRQTLESTSEFWALHDTAGLRLNRLYNICRPSG